MSRSDKPRASLSLDLDNLWSYLRIRGDEGWKALPSYLNLVVPRILHLLKRRQLLITFFIVGQDAEIKQNRAMMTAITDAGHEIGNHSFSHEPWLHRYSPDALDRELTRAEDAIESSTGRRPLGFRGPGYSLSKAVLEELQRRGYAFDASTFPTFLGPLARAYYFRTAGLAAEDRAERSLLFGTFRDGFRPVRAYQWRLSDGSLLEIPVTTLPGLKIPFHVSYLLYLSTYSQSMARAYLRAALRLCRVRGVQPSLLLHPPDFLGCDDLDRLSFLPGMNRPAAFKLACVEHFLDDFAEFFDIVPLGQHAAALEEAGRLPFVEPSFAESLSEVAVDIGRSASRMPHR